MLNINKGQIISFLVVLAVIVLGAQVAVLHGNNLKENKNTIQPAFIAPSPSLQQENPPKDETLSDETLSNVVELEKCATSTPSGSPRPRAEPQAEDCPWAENAPTQAETTASTTDTQDL